MFLPEFEYLAPETLAEALALLARYGERAKILAGGTDLLVIMKDRLLKPEVLVDISRLQELQGIRRLPGEGMVIGAAAKVDEVQQTAAIRAQWRALAEATDELGSVQVRGMATLGGNSCHASPAAETPPALVALGAKVTLAGSAGEREILLEHFILGNRKTALREGEILVRFFLPEPLSRGASVYLCQGIRGAMEIDLLNAAVYLVLEPDLETCAQARIVLGAVAPAPFRAEKAEMYLTGGKLGDKMIKETARLAAAQASPITDIRASAEYRRQVVEVLVRRAVTKAYERVRAGKEVGAE
ncbi:CO dehydrogenase flavoprotein C-terminal domain [Acididesulfobacillus acetoxydans]|uniref:CO dehydrogenase flavoprotein C-terminal domain n=1 Tax=Acididesulfobacillus acetoxydans TaxID=1561005 RepID=A0A8S0W2Y9_9FIRM|nr:xanthine dehydrogenase family protein subunit M [Acididesulfobacillus acetoxydans]CAA7601138.1 CO dehydrogenase flavoprotein C-terminal domain [Acididesulfobacillus acetoxydans]CEJ08583.1 Carbon-monoxide dehydrogenase (Acceptor) [Acididesulfobacillus acetoxydans]